MSKFYNCYKDRKGYIVPKSPVIKNSPDIIEWLSTNDQVRFLFTDKPNTKTLDKEWLEIGISHSYAGVIYASVWSWSNEDFNKYLLRGYGNSGEIFADPEQGWDSQDVRGSNGLRGTEKRRAAMIKALQEYSDSLEDNKYNFEGTQFTDLADAKAKIQTAINALKDTPTDESDDLPAFSALGLKYRSYFSNGGNDPYTKGDYTGTYQGYNDYLAEQEQAKQKAEQEKLKAQKANYWKGFKTFNFSNLNGRPLTSQEMNVDYLNQLFTKGNWSGDEASQIVSAFKLADKNGKLVSLSKEELNKLNPGTWSGRAKHLRKIEGLNVPLYYDTVSKQFKLFHNNNFSQSNPFQEVLDRNNPEKIKEKKELATKMAQDKHLANTEWTADKTRELLGIAADVGSVIDPEPISAGIMALGGTGLRTWNKAFDADGFTLSDAGSTFLDLGLSTLGAIPIVGDAALTARILGRLQKASGWLGAIFAASSVPQAAKAAWNKVVNGQDMTVDDWRAIGNVIMGATQARRIQLNRSAAHQVQQGNVNQSSPNRIQKIAEHNPTTQWNMKTKGEQESVKGPWYKKAWNYFKNPYAKPKVEEAPKEKSTIVKDTNSSKEISPEQISKIKGNIKKQFGDIDLSNTRVKHGTIQLNGNKIEVKRHSAVLISGKQDKVKQLRENTRKLLDKELDKAKSSKDVREVLAKIREAKNLGWYKQGGQINNSLDNIIEDFINNNNI